MGKEANAKSLFPLQNPFFNRVIITLVGDKYMAPDFGLCRLVETTHGDGDFVVVDRVPEQERAASIAETAADFFR